MSHKVQTLKLFINAKSLFEGVLHESHKIELSEREGYNKKRSK